MSAPVDHKVTAGAGGAGVGAVLAGLVVWLVGHAFGGGVVPPDVSDAIRVIIPIACGFAAGWLAPYTERKPPAPGA